LHHKALSITEALAMEEREMKKKKTESKYINSSYTHFTAFKIKEVTSLEM
jgi:hypothetical protein